MACSKHPKYTGVRLGKKALECAECVAFCAEVKAALPGGKEKRIFKTKAVDPAPLGEVFSDPVEENEVFKPVDESGLDSAL